jgi:hypothetical protein
MKIINHAEKKKESEAHRNWRENTTQKHNAFIPKWEPNLQILKMTPNPDPLANQLAPKTSFHIMAFTFT